MSQPLAVGDGVDDDIGIQIVGHLTGAIPQLPLSEPQGQDQDQDIADPDEEDILNSSQQSQASSTGCGLECPICLQSCVHPVELPCRHIFCFLCIKGVVTQGVQPRCAICRQDVPANVLTNPTLKDVTQLYKSSTSASGFLWYYESRGGGWWEYDVRTMQELEKAYEAKLPSTQLLIAGHLYEIDFPGMVQFRVGNRNLFRQIKRDVPRSDKRGIAGIRLRQNNNDGNPNSTSGATATTNTNFGVGAGGMISVSGGASATGTTHSHSNWSSSSAGGRRTRPPAVNRHYSSLATLESVIDSVATNNTQRSPPFSSPPGNSVTFFIPHAQNGDGHSNINGRINGNGADAEAETETDDDDEDEDSLDEEDDEDMRFGEEDDTTEEEDCDDFDVRDGARAPTSRSDRSTSSSNHNPSPSVRNGGRLSRSSTRASTTTPVDVPFSPVPISEQNGGGGGGFSRPSSTTTPTSPTGNTRVALVGHGLGAGPVTSSNTPLSVANNNGSTCIRIGPSLRITVDYDPSAHDDEVL